MPGPLTGIKIVDLCHAVVGPWGTMLLGSLGAEVIKVESPGGGDLIHGMPPKQRGLGVVYTHSNLNKRGIILDLKKEEGREVCYKLVEDADMLVENMRPGVADRLGLSYEKASEINPRIIYISAPAWGSTGPMAPMGGVDVSVQAFSGWTSLSGEDGGRPEIFRFGAQLDISTSSYIVAGALQALLIRNRTGKGMRLDVTMLGSSMNVQLSRMAEFFATGRSPSPLGSATVTTAPHQAFLCQDKKWLAVGVVNDSQWRGLCQALGLSDMTEDPGFATNPRRVENRRELVPILERVFLTKPSTWWSIRLAKERVPQGPFLDFEGLRHHAQALENDHIVEMDIPHQGNMLFGGLPWRFERTPARLTSGPYPGQHTQEVVEEANARQATRGPAPRGQAS